MSDFFSLRFEEYKTLVNDALSMLYIGNNKKDMTMEAALYSLTGKSKRVRPVLMLSIGDTLGVDLNEILPFACALEMIHTYSLIHDDLPGMDNDDFRRGQPTCHIKYTEALAILAGDSLLNRAYEILFESCINSSGQKEKLKAASYMCRMAGNEGMIGGQTLDILAEKKTLDAEDLKCMHQMKTGGLLKSAILVPVLFSGQEMYFDDFHFFAESLGLAFQIKDDILDATKTKEQLGKSAGKDERDEKSTYVSIFGLSEAGILLEKECENAFLALERLGDKGLDMRFLQDMNQFLLKREF